MKRRFFVQIDNYKGGIVFEEIGDAIAFLRLSLKGKRAEVQGYSDLERVIETKGNKFSLRIFEEAESASLEEELAAPLPQPEAAPPFVPAPSDSF